MRTVLIPTDFSENATHAIEYALKLFKCQKTNFYFLHAYADEVYGPFKKINGVLVEEQKVIVHQESEKRLKALIKKIVDPIDNPKHQYEIISAFDSLVDAVNDVVNEKNIDMVIMGTKGQTADKKVTFGSCTVQIFKYVQCPVLAIPQDHEYKHPKKILFPTDFMLPYKRRELKLLNNMACEYKSEIHFLHFSDFDYLSHRQEDNKFFLRSSLSNLRLFFNKTPVENKASIILEYIKKENIDMLVMVNSRHSFIEDMLYRSTVDEIGLRVRIPFLVMQNLPR